MAPGFINLREDDGNESEDELDLTGWWIAIIILYSADWCLIDLQAQYEVRLEQGLDAFVVIDGLPIVAEDNKQKLVKFLLKKLNTVGKTREDAIFMPINDKKMSEGYISSSCLFRYLLTDIVMRLWNMKHQNKLLLRQKPSTEHPLTKSTPWQSINLLISTATDEKVA